MIVNEPVKYVLTWFHYMGQSTTGYEAADGIIFLAHHGIYLATYAKPGNKKYFRLTKKEELNVSYKIEDRPALLTVCSERFPGKLHSVFWDGKRVLDPNPDVKKPRKLGSYKITEYWPLIMEEARHTKLKKGVENE